MKINTEKFILWLKENIRDTKHYECEAWRKREYDTARGMRDERNCYEYILNTITGNQDTDLGEFMEEDNEK